MAHKQWLILQTWRSPPRGREFKPHTVYPQPWEPALGKLSPCNWLCKQARLMERVRGLEEIETLLLWAYVQTHLFWVPGQRQQMKKKLAFWAACHDHPSMPHWPTPGSCSSSSVKVAAPHVPQEKSWPMSGFSSSPLVKTTGRVQSTQGCTCTRPYLQDWERQLYCLIHRDKQKINQISWYVKDNDSLFLIVRKGTTNMERKKTRMNSHDIRFKLEVLVWNYCF